MQEYCLLRAFDYPPADRAGFVPWYDYPYEKPSITANFHLLIVSLGDTNRRTQKLRGLRGLVSHTCRNSDSSFAVPGAWVLTVCWEGVAKFVLVHDPVRLRRRYGTLLGVASHRAHIGMGYTISARNSCRLGTHTAAGVDHLPLWVRFMLRM